MGRFFQKMVKSVYLLTALALILTALVVQSGRSLSPLLGNYSERIADYVARELSADVSIGAITADWSGLKPHIHVQDIAVATPTGEAIFTLREARLRLDILGSLVNARIVWSHFVLEGVAVGFQQTARGTWHIAGVAPRADAPQAVNIDALLDMLLLSSRIEMQNSSLTFQFHEGNATHVQAPSVLLENSQDFHRVSLTIATDDNPEQVQLVMEGRGDPRQPDAFESQGYLRIHQFPTSEPIAAASAFLLGGAAPLSGEGQLDAEIWFTTVAGQKGYDLVGQLGVQRIGVWLHEKPMVLDNLSTRIQGQWLRSGAWDLTLVDARAALGDEALDAITIGARAAAFRAPVQLNVDSVNLSQLTRMVKQAGALGALTSDRIQDVLETLNPQGHLRHVSMVIPVDRPEEWRVNANLHSVAISPWRGVPGITGLDGYVSANRLGGAINIGATNGFSMHYSPTYDKPMQYDRANGQVAWSLQPERNEIYVNSGLLAFEQGSESTRGYLWLNLPWKPKTDDVELYLLIGAKNLSASAYQKYTPSIAPKPLLAWLEQAVGANNPGVATEAGFLFRGTLNRPDPMARTLQVYTDVRHATLNYHEEWPALNDVSGQLLVTNQHVAADISHARVFDTVLSKLSLDVTPYEDGSFLTVAGEVNGPAIDGLSLLREGQLRKSLGDNFDTWSMTGAMKGTVALGIPLGNVHSQSAYQQVNVELDVPRLDIGNLNISVSELAGSLSYRNDTGLFSEALTGKLFGEPLDATISSSGMGSGQPETRLTLANAVDARQLAYWTQRPEVMFLTGRIPYEADIRLFHGREAKSADFRRQTPVQFEQDAIAHIDVRSSLKGATAHLPAPYGKTAEQVMPLRLQLWLQPHQSLVQLDYSDDVQALFRSSRVDERRLLNAAIGIGEPAQFLAQPGFEVSGFLPKVDIDAWRDVLNRYDAYSTQFTPTQAPVDVLDDWRTPDAATLVAGLPFKASLVVGEHYVGTLRLENLHVVAEPLQRGWRVGVNNDAITGQLLIPRTALVPLEVSIARLALTREALGVTETGELADEVLADDERELLDPRQLPLANITIDSLWLDDSNYGRWSMHLRPTLNGVVIERILGGIRGIAVNSAEPGEGATLSWLHTPDGMQSRFIGSLAANDLSSVMKAWGQSEMIESKRAKFTGDIYWKGAPQDVSLEKLMGSLNVDIAQGRFNRDTGAGEGILRLMSILNFDTLARRMRFDFSDLYKSGLAYDTISGQLAFNQGTINFVEPLLVQTPSSGMQLVGSIDLNQQTLDTRLIATLPVAGNLTFFAALATGLPAAAGIYVVSKLFKRQVDQATSMSYTIQGSWDNPQMRFDRLFESEKSLRDSVISKTHTEEPPETPRDEHKK